jgi:hypothetical protein
MSQPRASQISAVDATLATLARKEGSASHGHVATLLASTPLATARDLCDAVHHLCTLHGRHPGVIDYAVDHATGDLGKWLTNAAAGFAAERAYLTRLVVLAGPEPSTPGQADTIQAVVAQAHALTMLAQSDRAGTALGATIALILDWRAIRAVLDNAAHRLGIDPPPLDLPDEASSRAIATAAATSVAVERAMQFGAQQLLLQHRGLWDLLEARRDARAG